MGNRICLTAQLDYILILIKMFVIGPRTQDVEEQQNNFFLINIIDISSFMEIVKKK